MNDVVVIGEVGKLINCRVRGVERQLPESILYKREQWIDNWDADGVLHDSVHSTEYWYDNELVHRSADVKIKRMPEGMSTIVELMNR